MKVALANSQMFQSLYIDTDAEKSSDKIVLIEEMVESLPEAQQILTSLMKEPYYGMVVAGSNIAITKFRSKIYDEDKKDNIGSEDMGEMLAKIAEIAYDRQCEVVFFKGPVEHRGIPEQMKNTSVALDLKSLFDPAKIKNAGKEFWDNLIGVNKDLEKQYQALDLKKHAELVDYLDRNESSIIKLKEEIKKREINLPNMDKMLHEIEIDDNISDYLGSDYENLKYYYIPLDAFYAAHPKIAKPKQPTEEEQADDEFDPFDDKHQEADPRAMIRGILTQVENVATKKPMDKSNIADVGMDETHLIVALKKPSSPDLAYWPKAPLKRPTLDLIKRFHWSKNPNKKKK